MEGFHTRRMPVRERFWCSDTIMLTRFDLFFCDIVQPVKYVRNLGIFIDSDVSMKTHISKIVSSCFAALRRLRSIRRSLSQAVLLSLVTSLIMTRLDYGSAVLAGLPSHLLNRLQSVLNAAARLVYYARKYDHVTHLLRDLHWLRVPERIQFRLAVLAFCCRNHKAPSYLADSLHWTDEAESRHRLRSGSCPRLIVPRTRLSTIGDRSFRVTAHASMEQSSYQRHCINFYRLKETT